MLNLTRVSPAAGCIQRRFTRIVPLAASHGRPGVGDNPVEITWSIHARHQEVDDTLRTAVIDRLQPVIQKLQGGLVREAEGGVEEVDVRLMHSSCHIQLHPVRRNKQVHDTFLRQGTMEAVVTDGEGVWDAFSRAADQLEQKLRDNSTKRAPAKVDYRATGRNKGGATAGTNLPGTR
eukprot:CAMPEP_0202859290 /NCGR_PEP_ID=MMETSP1391-20130828/1472_1 /ASSEMBLY_ACC=CAM_ASM_000867 /TAXON_ID=1034604 /ORGANISM="Chlamydomonas leiostraca, Strain SAG 11-49" /LENGTH=176 /DNA_ID=CAMNT_0049538313 /DNA_START=65 /DNA_END=595 /DNA_ORIENTATION=+